jgi:hypothetical protein
LIFNVKGQLFWRGDTLRFALPLFIDALIIDGGNKSPHLFMHSSLMEATKHLIY